MFTYWISKRVFTTRLAPSFQCTKSLDVCLFFIFVLNCCIVMLWNEKKRCDNGTFWVRVIFDTILFIALLYSVLYCFRIELICSTCSKNRSFPSGHGKNSIHVIYRSRTISSIVPCCYVWLFNYLGVSYALTGMYIFGFYVAKWQSIVAGGLVKKFSDGVSFYNRPEL